MKDEKQNSSEFRVLNQVIFVDGYKISLNFLSEANEEIGPAIRAILLNKSYQTVADTLENSK